MCNILDGCELDNNIEFGIGDILEIPCPCQEYVHGLLSNQIGQAICGGTYVTGAQLLNIDFSQCSTVTNVISSTLCHAALVCC